MSFKAFMTFANEEPKSNGLVFTTRDEANGYARDLLGRWTMPADYEVRETDEPVTVFWRNGMLSHNPLWTDPTGTTLVTRFVTGELPDMLSLLDPRPAQEQLHERYQHGGGFNPFKGFELVNNTLVYPGDPEMLEMARTQLRDESIRLFECSWVAVVQPDGSFVVSRMD